MKPFVFGNGAIVVRNASMRPGMYATIDDHVSCYPAAGTANYECLTAVHVGPVVGPARIVPIGSILCTLYYCKKSSQVTCDFPLPP